MGRGEDVKVSGGGVGFGGLLTIVFIVLKLIGKIDWPWVWVLCPLWGSIVLTLLIFFAFVIIFFRK